MAEDDGAGEGASAERDSGDGFCGGPQRNPNGCRAGQQPEQDTDQRKYAFRMFVFSVAVVSGATTVIAAAAKWL